ncbi:MAG TPA: hypothetical protein PLB25_04355 [Rhodoferax sp.]|nr:hypothetical protein [Rhodoferax sp.]
MTHLNPIELAQRYFVNDCPEATILASRLGNILDKLQQGHQISSIALGYLHKQGFFSLERLIQGEITYPQFCADAQAEQAQRVMLAQAQREAKIAEEAAREAAWAARYALERQRAEQARIARESDPRYIKKKHDQQLRVRYGIDQFIEKDCFGRLMDILHRVDGANRFTDEDVVWLKTKGRDYYSDTLKNVFHQREAKFFASEYQRTHDAWMAVNASKHYRKCDQAQSAHDLLAPIALEQQSSAKLKSALCTTYGGAMRDLGQHGPALQLGQRAHALMPKDFRPCTLLGALHIEMGNYQLGQEWYAKAQERGASKQAIDQELRGIFQRADKSNREEIKAFLLGQDPVRYKWVNVA